MADRSKDTRDEEAAPPGAPRSNPATPQDEKPDTPAAEVEAEKARTEIAAGDVADDLADFA